MIGGRAFLTPDGKTLVTVGADGEAHVWELATGRLIRSIEAAEGALSADGKTLFAVGSGVLRTVNLSTGRERRRVKTDSGQNQEQLVVSPDGRCLAFLVWRWLGLNGGLRYRSHVIIYDAASLEERWRAEQDAWVVADVAFSRDSRLMALAGSASGNHGVLEEPAAGSIRLYDVASRAEVRRIAIEGFGVASAAFAPDGQMLVAGVGDRTIRRFDIATGEERLPRLGREGALPPRKPGEVVQKDYDKACAAACLAFSPDGSLLASGVEGIGWFAHTADVPPIRLWDWAAGREVRKLTGHPIGTISMAFTPDGKTLASSGFEPMARLWDVATGREVDHRPGHSSMIDGLAVSPVDGTVFTFSQADGPILHWNPASGRMIEAMGVYPNVINNMAISHDGRTLVLLPQGREPLLWDLAGRKALRNLGDEKHLGCCYAAFSPDGRMVTGQYRVWDVATGRRLASFQGDAQSWCLSDFSADGRRVITVELERVRIWDVATGAEVRLAVEKVPMARNAAISPDGRLVAVGQFRPSDGLDSREPDPPGRLVDPIRIWELASGKEVAALFGHTDISSRMAFSPDGRMLASASGAWWNRWDPGLRIWDVASGKPLRRFKDDPGSGVQIAYLPDGRSIVTAAADGTALVWDVSDLADRRPPEPLDTKVLEALWSDLASDDAPRAHRASWALSAEGVVPFLRDRLRPATAGEPTAGPEVLRTLRAIAALERIGSQPARELLERLARGDAGAPSTRDSTEALLRLSRRKTPPSRGATTR